MAQLRSSISDAWKIRSGLFCLEAKVIPAAGDTTKGQSVNHNHVKKYHISPSSRPASESWRENSNHFSDYARRIFSSVVITIHFSTENQRKRKKWKCESFQFRLKVYPVSYTLSSSRAESLLSENLLIGLVSNFTINSQRIVASRFACGIRWCTNENRNQPTNCLYYLRWCCRSRAIIELVRQLNCRFWWAGLWAAAGARCNGSRDHKHEWNSNFEARAYELAQLYSMFLSIPVAS